jgi:hypothetical protein
MANVNDIHSIIVAAGSPSTAHTYTEVYGGGAGCTITINGLSVTMAAGSSIKIAVRTVSGGSGCFLLGEKNDVFLGSPNVG